MTVSSLLSSVMSAIDVDRVRRATRLLRPLRTRCSALRKYTLRTKTDTVLLRVPTGIGERTFYKCPSDVTEYSRKVYAVRDCFRDIVTVTGRRGGGTRVIDGLAEMCAAVAGELLEGEEEKGVEKVYEAVPVEYRG